MDDARLIEGFTAHWRLLGHSPHTLDCYLGVLRRLDSLDADVLDLQAYLATRADEVSSSTLAVDVRALRSFYGWRSETLGSANPAAQLKTPKVHEAPIRVVSYEDYVKLLSSIPRRRPGNRRRATDQRDRAIVACFWSTGIRLAEMARIEADDVDLAGGVVAINRTKARRPRTVGLSEEAIKELRAYLRARPALGDGLRLWPGRMSLDFLFGWGE